MKKENQCLKVSNLKLILILSFTFLFSCSSTRVVRHNKFPVNIASSSSRAKLNVVVEFQEYFLLWGLMPSENSIDLSDRLGRYEIGNVGNITIEQYQTFYDQFLTLFSFGLYIPYHYRLSGWGDKRLVQ